MTAYETGFADKCAEAGIDPGLIKQALFGTALRLGREAGRLGKEVRRLGSVMGGVGGEYASTLAQLPAYKAYRSLIDAGVKEGPLMGLLKNLKVAKLEREGFRRVLDPATGRFVIRPIGELASAASAGARASGGKGGTASSFTKWLSDNPGKAVGLGALGMFAGSRMFQVAPPYTGQPPRYY